jgi:hypothetical protein
MIKLNKTNVSYPFALERNICITIRQNKIKYNPYISLLQTRMKYKQTITEN